MCVKEVEREESSVLTISFSGQKKMKPKLNLFNVVVLVEECKEMVPVYWPTLTFWKNAVGFNSSYSKKDVENHCSLS